MRSKSYDEGIEINSSQTINTYGEEYLWVLFRKESYSYSVTPLANHEISPKMRSKMVDWMIEVISVYNFLNDTFFLAVYLLDKYLSMTTLSLVDKDIHLIGIICMYMASKEEEVWPFNLWNMKVAIGHGLFDASTMKRKELEIIETLNWKLIMVTPMQFIEYIDTLLRNSFKSWLYSHCIENVRLMALQYCKLALINQNILQYKPSEIAAGAYALALDK